MGGCVSAGKKQAGAQANAGKAERAESTGKVSEVELRGAIDRIFEEFDKDKSGSLDKHEVLTLLNNSLGKKNMSEKEAQDFMRKVDTDGNNTIEKDELFRIYKQLFC
jgi:Ca2+-binding EF-hand superfamily protein